MPEPTPLAHWLRVFLKTEQQEFQHWRWLPRRQHPRLDDRRWAKSFPFAAWPDQAEIASTFSAIRSEASLSRLIPWLLDPEVRLLLARSALEWAVHYAPLAPGDLTLSAVAAQRSGVYNPAEIGQVAPRVAVILFTLASYRSLPQRLRRASERTVNQLANSVLRRLPTAPPADLIAIHVMMQRLLSLKRSLWVQTALDLCRSLSPLTCLLEAFDPLARAKPDEWIGIEALLANPGLEGLQTRCAQTLLNSTMPGWDWHESEVPIRHARFQRASQFMGRLAWALDQPNFGPVRSLHLAVWVLHTYKLIGKTLDVFQRIVLPPAINPDQPGLTPSFRTLRLFLPTSVEDVQAYYAGCFTAMRPALTQVVEASRLTETPVYIPEGLPQIPLPDPYPDTPEIRAAAAHLIDVWQTIATTYGPTLSNLYQFANASRADLTMGIFALIEPLPAIKPTPRADFTPIGSY